ncbi:uroporphyrinogen-III C-methyltransferase [Selenomonas sp. TAMA-11512]|uniref:uroporphyrinogen-III C-methyltransferase n=1 Tax=Selenomonas sp. TAMA-11512 TaxID=3095337 RepID=UPI00308AD468|nr:uroporphyrinogen-III C-methyltransferase [Selenomonas sp. TAMA-11512]
MEKQGIVYLVGAGPGDPGLLTCKAKSLLERAEVVVYDYLADERILSFVPKAAELIYVGKSAGRHTMKQDEISRLLAKLGKEGKRIVRLKGGDPFVFGRGGEEALTLLEAGVPFEIVPGVTSAIAVPAYAGIPVTHRGIAASFAVITGHEDPTKNDSSIHWDKLAGAVDTLVFLMGVENLPNITEKLMEHGKSPDTPAALIRWGTRPYQETLETTLRTVVEDVRRAELKPPAIFIVGEVAKLRKELRWFDDAKTHPLFGKRVLVTRARAQASALSAKLEALGAETVETPVIKIVPPSDGYEKVRMAIRRIAGYAWIIFTSTNGVHAFMERLEEKELDSRALASAQIAAIGESTANALKAYGIKADIVPREFRAEGILDALQGQVHEGQCILIPRAEEAREILPEKLRALGAVVDVAPVYKTVTETEGSEALRDELAAGRIDLITFTSSSTVKNLVRVLGGIEPLKGVKTAAIGPVTADTARSLGIEPDITAETYTTDGLVEAIVKVQD